MTALVAGAGEGTTGDKARTLRNTMFIRVDFEALTRGTVDGDERCEIPGVGPVAVSAARDLRGESILKPVITRGVEVLNVTHLGRGPMEAQKVALLFRHPLCTVEGYRTRCEYDHTVDWQYTHHTRIDELAPSAHTTTASRPCTAGRWSKAPANERWSRPATPATRRRRARCRHDGPRLPECPGERRPGRSSEWQW